MPIDRYSRLRSRHGGGHAEFLHLVAGKLNPWPILASLIDPDAPAEVDPDLGATAEDSGLVGITTLQVSATKSN